MNRADLILKIAYSSAIKLPAISSFFQTSLPLSPYRLPLRVHFHRKRDAWVRGKYHILLRHVQVICDVIAGAWGKKFNAVSHKQTRAPIQSVPFSFGLWDTALKFLSPGPRNDVTDHLVYQQDDKQDQFGKCFYSPFSKQIKEDK